MTLKEFLEWQVYDHWRAEKAEDAAEEAKDELQ